MHSFLHRALSLSVGALGCAAAACQEPAAVPLPAGAPDQPIELGAVRWQRDFAAAEREALRRDRPLLVLFQEVPG